jgi:Ice-binding-like/FG-GAP-like repeat
MLHVSGQGGRITAPLRPTSGEIVFCTRSRQMAPRIAEAASRFSRSYFSFLAGLAFTALLSLAHSGAAVAATAPPLGTNSTFGVVDSTYTNTQPGMTITGDLCYTTAPARNPTLNGTLTVPCNAQQGMDETTAKANMNAQTCTAIGAAVALDTIVVGTNPAGTFPPGCYSSTGTMTTTGGTTVTLNGYGVYIFRSGAGISTAANSNFRLINGACAADVYWSPTAATTLGANTTFAGTILDVAGITMESLVKLAGRALAYGATVTTDADTIIAPARHCPSQLVDARQADFNGDSKADILWRNVSGEVEIWFMNGTSVLSKDSLGIVANDWQIAGVGDFNGDGKADILWRNASGEVYILLMNGTKVIGGGSAGTIGNDWHIAGVGDFNGDGKADTLWRNNNGEGYILLMNVTKVNGAGSLGIVGNDWQISGVGDFNGDGKPDILWRNNNGEVSIWFINGTTMIGGGSAGTIGNDWRIAGVGDFNGDSKSDILWRNDSGEVYETWMNGINLIGGGSAGMIGTDWQIE